ncbi:MAG: SAM-dependent methyltransferase [Roseburia sp.]|nr:SAM-dependent methyltransferase [Roseburia sp.]
MAKHARRAFQSEAMKEVATVLDKLSCRYSRWEIWQDFVTMAAISIANTVNSPAREGREQMYLDRAKKYRKEELDALASMLAAVVVGMEENPEQDFLGEMYMGLDLGNDAAGQFFTPYHVCHLMAEVTAEDNLAERVEKEGWISVNDPCCGGGALLLAFANVCQKRGLNFQTSVLFAAQDIDFTVAMMCYIQLSLMGCAGYVKIGNSLTDPLTCYDSKGLLPAGGDSIWYTPMYCRDIWHYRRLWAQLDMVVRPLAVAPDATPSGVAAPGSAIATPITPEAPDLRVGKGGQLTLF